MDDLLLAEFVYFPDLPAEIRLEVWNLALPDTRFIEIRSCPGSIMTGYNPETSEDCSGHRRELAASCRNGSYPLTHNLWKLFCPEKAPALFFVCQESRSVVKKTYQPFRGPASRSPTIFCDFSKDVLVFSNKRCQLSFDAVVLEMGCRLVKQVRHLMLEDFSPPEGLVLVQFPSLKTLYYAEDFYSPELPKNCSLNVVGFLDFMVQPACQRCGRNYPACMSQGQRRCLWTHQIMRTGDMEYSFNRALDLDGDWKAPELIVGQVVFSEHADLEWVFIEHRWKLRSHSTFVPGLREDHNVHHYCDEPSEDCRSTSFIRGPGFRYYLSHDHFPCRYNKLVWRIMEPHLLDQDLGPRLDDWPCLVPTN